jgi:RNase P protein component
MHGAPRAASAWPSDSSASGRGGWSKRDRLLLARDFAALAGPAAANWGAARRWIALSARIESPGAAALSRDAGETMQEHIETLLECAPLRFGIAVPRRQARRAVARNMVKRVLREAARAALPALRGAGADARADVLMRLKQPLPRASAAGWAAVKRELRAEADDLMRQLGARLARGATGRAPAPPLAQSAVGVVKRTETRP